MRGQTSTHVPRKVGTSDPTSSTASPFRILRSRRGPFHEKVFVRRSLAVDNAHARAAKDLQEQEQLPAVTHMFNLPRFCDSVLVADAAIVGFCIDSQAPKRAVVQGLHHISRGVRHAFVLFIISTSMRWTHSPIRKRNVFRGKHSEPICAADGR
jgi:hypothetical protein